MAEPVLIWIGENTGKSVLFIPLLENKASKNYRDHKASTLGVMHVARGRVATSDMSCVSHDLYSSLFFSISVVLYSSISE